MPHQSTRLRRACLYCSKEFAFSPSQDKKYCSLTCRSMDKRRPLTDRFWEKVNKTDSCWEWIGARLPKGYGFMTVKRDGQKRNYYAHRLAYSFVHGDIPEGFVICHRCDNPSCVNPDHLFLGTYADNTHDAMAKGRPIGRPRRTEE